MKLRDSSIAILTDLRVVLSQMDDSEFGLPLAVFSSATVGQHTRHILEFFQCLIDSKDSDHICYDDRARNLKLESNVMHAITTLDDICSKIDLIVEDKPKQLSGQLGNSQYAAQTSVERELVYVVEHAVHHMAVIKIGLLINFPNIQIPENFGVADSTLRFKNEQCAP